MTTFTRTMADPVEEQEPTGWAWILDKVHRERDERERRERVADLHSNVDFAGLTWVVERGQVRAMTTDDVAWLDAHWSFVERWLW